MSTPSKADEERGVVHASLSQVLKDPNGDDGVSDSLQISGQDEIDIARWGKRQQLRRNFGLPSVIALTCTMMITWEGMLGYFESGFINGGPSGLVYGFLVTWVGVFSQVLVAGEMASMIPLAGGQYNWVAILAPPSCSKFLSYLTGWVTAIGWQAAVVTTVYTGGALIQGLLIQNYPTYSPQNWQTLLLGYATLAVTTFINTVLARVLPQIESLALILHLFGFFAVLIPLVYFAPKSTPSMVFNTFLNEGGWPTQGLSFFIGLTTSMTSFLGIDAGCHIAEEIVNASTVIPISMLTSVAINGTLGFAITIAVLFCIGDVDAALNSPTAYPMIEIFHQALNSDGGSSVLVALLIVANNLACVGCMASSSRMLWAFAREKGLPGHQWLSRVEKRTVLPLYSIGLTAVIALLLTLIDLGSTVVLQGFLSLSVGGFYSAYLISAGVMLRKRIVEPETIRWGPFKLGRFGIPVTIFSILYSAQGVFFSFWPVQLDTNASNMNWSIAVFGGAMLLAMIFWFTYGRRVYKGPIVEVHYN